MVTTLFLILCILVISAPPSSLGDKSVDSGVHLTLHHVRSNTSKVDLLESDEARVRFINHRINTTSRASPEATASAQNKEHGNKSGGAVDVPVKPGEDIGTGNYYVKMGLGTPVNYYDMVIDTGSSLTWLQCRPCQVYCHPQDGKIYNPSKSKTHKYLPCNVSQCADLETATSNSPICMEETKRCLFESSYGDKSYSIGYLSNETLTLSGTSKSTLSEFTYGCAEDTQGMFGKAAGLIGLAHNKLSLGAQLSPKYGYVFSYCLPTSTSSGGGNGSLSIGKSAAYKSNGYAGNDKSPNTTVSYEITPMITDRRNPSFYYVHWTGMTVNGKPLKGVSSSQYKNSSTILDSGTVISRLPTSIYKALSEAFVKAMSPGYNKAPAYSLLDTCYYQRPKNNGTKNVQRVPKMSMVFQGGAQLMLGPQNVVTEVEKGVSCLAFARNTGTEGITIIGNIQQQTSKILYDVADSKIGFAAGSCH